MMVPRLQTLTHILKYLDEFNQFRIIKEWCDYYITNESIVYIFPVDINLHDVFEKSVCLGEKILASPVESSNLFHEVIFEYIKCQGLLPVSVTSSQVLAKLCITGLPGKNFQICKSSDLTKYTNYQGLIKLTGMVTGMSALTKYTQSTKYVCPDDTCQGHYGHHFIRIHIPGALETQTVRSDFMCTFCGRILDEMINSRTLSDKMIAEVIPISLEGYQRKECPRGQLTHAVPVIIRDDLFKKVSIGKSYHIIGICRADYSEEEITITLEANSIQEISACVIPAENVLQQISEKILCIYNGCTSYQFGFLLHMAIQFAGDIVPLGKMIKLRIYILISLVLSAQKNKLHILAIGKETQQAFAVMSYAVQFSNRCCLPSVATPLNGKVSNDKYAFAPYYIQGGSLLLNHEGHCLFGEIGLWKKSRKEQLKTYLNSNKVMIELPPKYSGSLPQMVTYPLSCHCWATYDISGCKPSSTQSKDDLFTGSLTGDLTKSFLDSFNVIAFTDIMYSFDFESDHQFLDFIWRQRCSDTDEQKHRLKLDASDYEKYLYTARHIDPVMSVEAEVLLHSHFTASRMARTNGTSGSHVPPSGLATLTSLSIGIAKLQLHDTVTEKDAVFAVYLFEEYITSRYGLSVLGVQPQPDVSDYEIDNFLGLQTEMMIQDFHVRLQQFCGRVKDSFCLTSSSRISSSFKEE